MYCPSSLSSPPPPPVVVKRVVAVLGVLVKQNINVGRAIGEWKGRGEREKEGKGKEREGEEGEGEGERFLVVLIDLLRFWRERNICLVGPLVEIIHNSLLALPREEEEKGGKKEGDGEKKGAGEKEGEGESLSSSLPLSSSSSSSSSSLSPSLIPLLTEETLGGVGGVLGMVLPEATHTTALQIIKYLSLRKVIQVFCVF